MGNQKYIVPGKSCSNCGEKMIEYNNQGDEEIEKCLECGQIQ